MKVVHTPVCEKSFKASEKGFSLVIVLFFVGLVTSIIMYSTMNQRGAVQRDQARAAGWHLAQVAKAARVYVRDRSLEEGDPYYKYDLVGSQPITMNQLRAANLLPDDFPDQNPLGQTVSIMAANYPVGAPVADNTTVASAFVVLNSNDLTQNHPGLMQYVSEGARKSGLMVNAAIYGGSDPDDAGVAANRSEECKGTPAVAVWDTGCLNQSDWESIAGAGATMPQGALVAPAWRSVVHDPRIVARFAQPENPDANIMVTALEMTKTRRNAQGGCKTGQNGYVRAGDAAASDDDNGGGWSGEGAPGSGDSGYQGRVGGAGDSTPVGYSYENDTLCGPQSNDIALDSLPNNQEKLKKALKDNDKRFDMLNVAKIDVENIVSLPQNPDNTKAIPELGYRVGDGGRYSSTSEYDFVSANHHRSRIEGSDNTAVMYISGNMITNGDVQVIGENNQDAGAGVAAVSFIGTGGATRPVRIDHNISSAIPLEVGGRTNINQASVTDLRNRGPNAIQARVENRTDSITRIDASAVVVNRNDGCGSANSPCGLVTKDLNLNENAVTTDDAIFYREAHITRNDGTAGLVVDGSRSGVPALVTYRAEGNADVSTERLLLRGAGTGVQINNTLTIGGTTILAECFDQTSTGNQCPDMTPDPGDVELP